MQNYSAQPKSVEARMKEAQAALAELLSLGVGQWSSDHLQEARTFTGWNYVAITAVARQCAKSHTYIWDGSSRAGKETRRSLRSLYGRTWARSFAQDAAAAALPDNHVLHTIVNKPSPKQSLALFKWEYVQQMRLHGSCIIFYRQNVLGTFSVHRHVIPMALTQPIAPGAHEFAPNGGIRVMPSNAAHGLRRSQILALLSNAIIPIEMLGVISYPPTYMMGTGLSPTDAISTWIDSSRMIDTARFKQMRRGPKPRGIVTAKDLTDEQCEDLQDRLNAELSTIAGEDDSQVIVVRDGTSIATDYSPEDMGYTGGFDQLMQAILAAEGCSKASVGLQDGMTYSSLAASMNAANSISVQPDLDLLGQHESMRYSEEHGTEVEIEHEAQPYDDPTLTEQQLQTDLDAGIRTVRQWLAIRGLPPFGDWRDDARVTREGLVLDKQQAQEAVAQSNRLQPVNSSGFRRAAGDQEGLAAVVPAKRAPTMAVDFDGTLAEFDGEFDPATFGAPIAANIQIVRDLHAAGVQIIIFTMRDDTEDLRGWLDRNRVPYQAINESLDVALTHEGKVFADAYWDDRAVQAGGSPKTEIAQIVALLPDGAEKRRALKLTRADGEGYIMLTAPPAVAAAVAEAQKKLSGVLALEENPHVTLLPKIVGSSVEEMVGEVRRVPKIEAVFGQIVAFEDDPAHDVIVVEVKSEELMLANKKLSAALPTLGTYEYRPHLTLAFVQKGKGRELGSSLDGLTGRAVEFSQAKVSLGSVNASVPLRA